ncbi:MAG: heterodisulfide reductase [Deltaproteobacteria bacterium]|nr:heterodisulfide reductase [Deltaproteobacteria bacterium]
MNDGAPPISNIRPAYALPERLRQYHLQVSACYQCRKCSGGCPLTFAMDLLPDRVIRLALLGQEDLVLNCRTIWVCSSCETCTTRCSNGIDIAAVMDWLKEEALKRGLTTPQPEVAAFQRLFLDNIRAGGGRLSETRLLGNFTLFKLRRGFNFKEHWANAKLGYQLFKRGRLKLQGGPKLKAEARREVENIFNRSGFKS